MTGPEIPNSATRLLAALPYGHGRHLRWLVHRAQVSHAQAINDAKQLIAAGVLERATAASSAMWFSGTVLLRRVMPQSSTKKAVHPRAERRSHQETKA